MRDRQWWSGASAVRRVSMKTPTLSSVASLCPPPYGVHWRDMAEPSSSGSKLYRKVIGRWWMTMQLGWLIVDCVTSVCVCVCVVEWRGRAVWYSWCWTCSSRCNTSSSCSTSSKALDCGWTKCRQTSHFVARTKEESTLRRLYVVTVCVLQLGFSVNCVCWLCWEWLDRRCLSFGLSIWWIVEKWLIGLGCHLVCWVRWFQESVC